MRHFFIFLITLYQKYLSPYKGFKCAYAEFTRRTTTSALSELKIVSSDLLHERISDNSVNDKQACYHNTKSCSVIIKNIIAEHGVIASLPLIKQQFANCYLAYVALETERDKRERKQRERQRRQQRGCFSKKNQERCDCASNVGDCIPDLPCEGFDCSISSRKLKNLFKKSHNTHAT